MRTKIAIVVLLICMFSSTVYGQFPTRDVFANYLTVSGQAQFNANVPVRNYGYYWQTYNYNYADAFRVDYHGVGHYIMNLQANGSSVLLLNKAGDIGLGKVPSYRFDIATLDQNAQRGLNLIISADTDNDHIYGTYSTVGVGDTTCSTAVRKAYGHYNVIENKSDTDPGWAFLPVSFGMYNSIDPSPNPARLKELRGVYNLFTDYSGAGTNYVGYEDVAKMGGLGASVIASTADSFKSYMFLKNDDAAGSTGHALIAQIQEAGSSDTWYGVHFSDSNAGVTGGTAYGYYVDLDAAGWDTAWSVFVVDGSANSYFGSDVGIGTTPLNKLHVNSATVNTGILLQSTDPYAIMAFEDNGSTVGVGPYLGALSDDLIIGRGATTWVTINDSTGNLGINTTGPDRRLDVLYASAPQARFTHTDGTFWNDIETTSTGDLQITSNLGLLFRTIGAEFSIYVGEHSGEDAVAGSNLNTCFGHGAGMDITTADYNTCLGAFAGMALTEASNQNVFVGSYAGRDAVNSSTSNTSVGYVALENLAGGDYNTAVGALAMRGAVAGITGDHNTAIGAATLDAVSSGLYNMALGREALTNLTSGHYNTAVGALAGRDLTIARENVMIGYQAGLFNVEGWSNVYVGAEAGRGATAQSQQHNVYIGHTSGYSVTTGDNSIFIGSQTGYYNQTGGNNVCVGYNSALGVTGNSFSNNIFIGYCAGDSVTTGSSNIVIGYDEDLPAAGTNNHMNIGGLLYADLSSDLFGVNTVTPDTIVEVADESTDTVVTVSTYGDGGAIAPAVTFRKADNTEASPAPVDTGDILGEINFNGYDDDSFDNGARIYSKADANWGAAERGAELYFSTRDGAGALTDQFKITAEGDFEGVTSKWWACNYISMLEVAAGGSGATWTAPDANIIGGYQLNADTEYLYFTARICPNWDGASDLRVGLRFEVNVNNIGGLVTDTVDFQLICYYKGATDTASKTQTLEEATVVGQSPQYQAFDATFTIDYDIGGGNDVDLLDVMSFRLNLETDTSEVDDVVANFAAFAFKTAEGFIQISEAP